MPGPHIQVAAFCEKVLTEQDGTASLIRVVDRITVSGAPGAPDELPEGRALPTTLFVALKADDAKGRHVVKVRAQQPSGAYLGDHTFDVMFEGDERGVNLVLALAVEAIEGLYWFEILVNDRLLTRTPLRIMYQRAPRSL